MKFTVHLLHINCTYSCGWQNGTVQARLKTCAHSTELEVSEKCSNVSYHLSDLILVFTRTRVNVTKSSPVYSKLYHFSPFLLYITTMRNQSTLIHIVALKIIFIC